MQKKKSTKGTKKGTKRGPYKKKSKSPELGVWAYKKSVPSQWLNGTPDTLIKPLPVKNELDFLATFCDDFEKYDDEAKSRIMTYIMSKYKDNIYLNGVNSHE